MRANPTTSKTAAGTALLAMRSMPKMHAFSMQKENMNAQKRAMTNIMPTRTATACPIRWNRAAAAK